MRWESFWAFNLIPLLICLWGLRLYRGRKSQATLKFSSTGLMRGVKLGYRARLAPLVLVMKVVAISLFVVAMARPQKADTKVNRNVEGIDIMLALDVSDSMDIEDMKPDNRLTAAKQVIRKFINGRQNDRIGLVVFAGESFTRVPLTLDYPILLRSLKEVETEGLKQGTAIGVALANAVARLKESRAKSRVVILLTDGESNTGTIDPLTALDIAKGYGIKVYTIGVGVDGQAQLPIISRDAFGRKVKRYQPIHSKVNDDLLQKIADETGGKYYRATNTSALRNVFASINRLEKTKIDVNEYVRYTELFPPFLLWGAFLYLIQLILSQTWLRRYP